MPLASPCAQVHVAEVHAASARCGGFLCSSCEVQVGSRSYCASCAARANDGLRGDIGIDLVAVRSVLEPAFHLAGLCAAVLLTDDGLGWRRRFAAGFAVIESLALLSSLAVAILVIRRSTSAQKAVVPHAIVDCGVVISAAVVLDVQMLSSIVEAPVLSAVLAAAALVSVACVLVLARLTGRVFRSEVGQAYFVR